MNDYTLVVVPESGSIPFLQFNSNSNSGNINSNSDSGTKSLRQFNSNSDDGNSTPIPVNSVMHRQRLYHVIVIILAYLIFFN